MTNLSALTLCCTLKPSPAESSSERLGREVLTALERHGFATDLVRVVDHDVKFGIETDMGNGDAWPSIRAKVLAADVLVIATPIWLGQPASVCKMVMERLNAELSETDESGRQLTYGKVGVVAVVGNEDGAHHTAAEVFQGLVDVGFTVPAEGSTYWVGEAMQPTDYLEKDPPPEKTAQTTETVAAHAAHLARLLKESNYPA
jgi:multimeric flavodoxin WrbA